MNFSVKLSLVISALTSEVGATPSNVRSLQDTDAPVYDVAVPSRENDPLFAALDIPGNAAEVGMWSRLDAWPLVSIHIAVIPDGRVVCYGAPTDEGVQDGRIFVFWDPLKGLGSSSISISPNAQEVDSFCSSGTLLSNGDFLVAGGKGGRSSAGSVESSLLDWKTEVATRTNDLNAPRWYGTMTKLPDGRALITGGGAPFTDSGWRDPEGQASRVSSTPEVYTEGEGWTFLDGAFSLDAFGAENNRYWYPRQWVTASGTVFGISTDKMWEMSVEDGGSIKTLGDFKTKPDNDSRPNVGPTGTSVMYDAMKILQVGGNGYKNGFESPSSAAATIFDITNIADGEVNVVETSQLNIPRQWANSCVLQNGHVLVTGGSQFADKAGDDSVFPVEIWNPDTGDWTVGASAAVHRGYHSSIVLLQNGIVFSSGGGLPGPVVNFNAELYYPPDLFEKQGDISVLASRPRIVSLSTTSPEYESVVQVQITGGGNEVSEVALNALPAVTHSFDSSQRRLKLNFLSTAVGVDVTMPANANLAPPGYYYFSVLNTDGVPSVAVIIGLGAAAPTGGGSGSANPYDVAATFYTNANFQSTPWPVQEGTYDIGEVQESPVGNDSISSINVNPGVAVRVCTDGNGGGFCETFTEDKAELEETLNDKISYVEVFPVQDSAATFYQDADFQGAMWPVNEGIYDYPVILQSPVGNDMISSFKVSPGVSVRACVHGGGGGFCETFSGDVPSLNDNLNDEISYIEVTRTES